METYIFTFGSGHACENKAVKVIGGDFKTARAAMVERHGLDWAFQYEESFYYSNLERLGLKPYPIIEVLEVKK